MNARILKYPLLITSVVLLIGCAKKVQVQQKAPQDNEVTRLLINKEWVETNVVLESYGEDITSGFARPDRDDLLSFSNDGTYRFDEGGLKHHEATQQIFVEGTWTYDMNTKILALINAGDTTKYELVGISEEEMVLKLSVNTGRKSYVYRLQFSKR